MTTQRKYRGKYPYRVNTIYSVSLPETYVSNISGKVRHKQEMRIMLNNGERYRLTKAYIIANNHLLPNFREDIDLSLLEKIETTNPTED